MKMVASPYYKSPRQQFDYAVPFDLGQTALVQGVGELFGPIGADLSNRAADGGLIQVDLTSPLI